MQVDQATLATGRLCVDFEWPVRGAFAALRAEFPSAYPYMRPHVFLQGDSASWPDRHISPLDGGLCLLGRNSAQWQPEDGLAGLLELQLEAALHGGGAEDPQAEPAEYWWNQAGAQESYCLVDSDWDLSGATGGWLELRVVVDPPKADLSKPHTSMPRIRAVVTRVLDAHDKEVARWEAPLPFDMAGAKTIRCRWQRLADTLYPRQGHVVTDLTALRKNHFGGFGAPILAAPHFGIRPFVFVHPVELAGGQQGDGWLLGLDWGSFRSFQAGRNASKQAQVRLDVIPIYRAGQSDLGARVPAFSALAGKRIAIVGLGALGAPIAMDLARNGVSQLLLLDHDSVEPGNSVRWPLGVSSWGRTKGSALKDWITAEYPGCDVRFFVHAIGAPGPQMDDEVLEKTVDVADVVIDATASHGVNRVLWDRCQRTGRPLVRLGATPSVAGGTVALHLPGGGCPVCIDCARDAGDIDQPDGADAGVDLQPPGCGEATFSGADYDLKELSLQAIRAVIGHLSNGQPRSRIFTLSLRDQAGTRVPEWSLSWLDRHPTCPCLHDFN